MPALALHWLYVDFNSYFASVEQQLRPELRGKPIAVVAVETDSTSAIAASYEAKAFGVKTGTKIHEAKRLCPGLACILARHECYVEFHHRLIEEIEQHIPVTAVCSIDEVASRLRRMEYYASAMSLAARLENNMCVHAEERVYRAQDHKTFLDLLNRLWARALPSSPGIRIRKVSVTLSDLVASTNLQAELFASQAEADLAGRSKAEKLSRAKDKINHRYARGSILIGMTPADGQSFAGSKIAFSRIPDLDEFLE